MNFFPNLHVIIVGDGEKLVDIKFLSQKIEETCNDTFIHVVGEQKNLHAFYSAADCIVGTGRVALEAMASERQIIAVGNHGYFGIVNNENLDEAWNHYFGDHGSIMPCSRHIVKDDLIKLLTDQELKKMAFQNEKINLYRMDWINCLSPVHRLHNNGSIPKTVESSHSVAF